MPILVVEAIIIISISGIMSFRRALILKNAIPKRGLEEFLNSAKVVGQDTVYGIFSIANLTIRSCLEIF